ncbi:hypothetical protein V8E52_007384 [Russula decolorans]
MTKSTLFLFRDEMEDQDLVKYSRRISLRAPPPPNLRPVLTIPEGRAADWHQRIGTYKRLPPPKHVAHRNSLPQPVWELRLNPDYGTLPGLPFLEALQGVGTVGIDVPAFADRLMKLNIYWPQAGQLDYEEWFESVDIWSMPVSSVAYILADLYRGLFERVGPRIRAVSPEWQIRSRADSMGICFGQLRLTRLYSYDYARVYPEIVVVTPR